MHCASKLSVLAGVASLAIVLSAGAQQRDDDPSAHLVLAESALQAGRFNVAAREYVRAAQLASSESLAAQAARVAFEHRQDTLAIQAARLWMDLNPSSLDARRYLGLVSLRVYAMDEAVRQFERLLMMAYKSPAQGFLDLSNGLSREDAYAVFLLMQALEARFSDLPEAHYALGAAALRAYNYVLALANAREALTLKTPFPEADQLLSRVLVATGQTEEGLARARAAGEGTQARLNLAVLLAEVGHVEAARTELTALLSVAEAKPEALLALASLDLSEGKLDEAARHFTELLTTGRHVSLAFYSLGLIYERQRDSVRAIRYYTRITGGESASQAQLRAARLLVNNGARDQANQLLDAFSDEHPETHIDIAIGRAQLLTEEGAADAALAVLEEAQRRYPDSETVRFAHSMTLERADRSEEAAAELRTILQRRPEDPTALNALGYALAEHRRSVREAEVLVRRALEKVPDNPAVQDSLGWVLHRLGQNTEALKWLNKAYKATRDAEVAAHIGEVYWAMGEKTKARQTWQAALALEPNHRYLLGTLQRYQE